MSGQDSGSSGAGDPTRRTWLAEERTWLAWWRTGLATAVAAIGVGRVAPELLGGAAWPYAVAGCVYGLLAAGMFIGGFVRHREAQTALREGRFEPLQTRWVEVFTGGGIVLALAALALILVRG